MIAIFTPGVFITEYWSLPYECYPESLEMDKLEQAYESSVEKALNGFLLYCLRNREE